MPSPRYVALAALLVAGTVVALWKLSAPVAEPLAELEPVVVRSTGALPPPPVLLGRGTFAAEEQVRIRRGIERLLEHPSAFCVELARAAWHRWQDDRISNGAATALCPAERFGYMGRKTGETYLCARAFVSDLELVTTLAHEERHHLRPEDRHARARDWDAMCR